MAWGRSPEAQFFMSSCDIGREEVRKGLGQGQVAKPREPVACSGRIQGGRLVGELGGREQVGGLCPLGFSCGLSGQLRKKRPVYFLCS